MVRVWKEGSGKRKKGPYENLQLSYADTNLLQRLARVTKRSRKRSCHQKNNQIP